MIDHRSIEKVFSNLQDSLSSNLTADERTEVKCFIDVGEYGLAFETLSAIYLEGQTLPDEDGKRVIDALAAEMSMEPVVPTSREGVELHA